jgi:hypothetical protein
MKRSLFIFLFLSLTLAVAAQVKNFTPEGEEEKQPFFKKQNVFTGGTATLSFFNDGSVIGLSPYLGYSLNKYVDVAANFNFNLTSFRNYPSINDKIREYVYGAGAFVRLYPVQFLFAQASYEYNFTTQKINYNNPALIDESFTLKAPSLLIGGGYCSGRYGVGDTFYYFSILFDVTKKANSPYVNQYGQNVPIINAGLQFGLFQKK